MHKNIPEPGITIPIALESPFTSPLLHNSPKDEEFTEGIFIQIETGNKFALATRSPNIYGRTHFLKNSRNFWEGTEAEFRVAFNKA